MNRNQKIVLLISSLLLLFGTVFFLFFPLTFSSIFFASYFVLIVLLAFIFVLGFSNKKIKDETNPMFDKSNQILFSARSVFPFQLFQDKYFIQEKTLSIVRKEFFSQGWIETIAIQDIAGIRMYTGPLFSSITIIRKVLPQTLVEMKNLWKSDAFKMKELLDGLMMTGNQLVDMPKNVNLKTQKKILIEIGKENEVEKVI